jgi:hypothetical protein
MARASKPGAESYRDSDPRSVQQFFLPVRVHGCRALHGNHVEQCDGGRIDTHVNNVKSGFADQQYIQTRSVRQILRTEYGLMAVQDSPRTR